jgi:hypothetical protein
MISGGMLCYTQLIRYYSQIHRLWFYLPSARQVVAVAAAVLLASSRATVQNQDNYDYYDPYGTRFQVLVGAAVLSIDTQHRLLNGQRRQVSTEFGLSDQETETVMAVKADTIQVFAQALDTGAA